MTIARPDPYRTLSMSSVLRWVAATVVVVAAHGALAWAILTWEPVEAASGEPPPAVMIELASLAVAAEAAPEELPPGPKMVEQTADPTPEEVEDPVEEPEAPPEPVEEEKEPPEQEPPEKQPPEKEPPEKEPPPAPPQKPEEKTPDLKEADKAEAILPPPPPPPAPRPKAERKPPPERARKSERVRQAPRRQPAPRTTAPPSSRAQRADRSAAPFAGAARSPSRSPATWQSAMLSHLNRFKRFPPGASGSGMAMVAFTINRSGAVVGSRLIRSSGNAAFDAAAVALPRRASPMPPPPPGFGGSTISLTVPIRFVR